LGDNTPPKLFGRLTHLCIDPPPYVTALTLPATELWRRLPETELRQPADIGRQPLSMRQTVVRRREEQTKEAREAK